MDRRGSRRTPSTPLISSIPLALAVLPLVQRLVRPRPYLTHVAPSTQGYVFLRNARIAILTLFQCILGSLAADPGMHFLAKYRPDEADCPPGSFGTRMSAEALVTAGRFMVCDYLARTGRSHTPCRFMARQVCLFFRLYCLLSLTFILAHSCDGTYIEDCDRSRGHYNIREVGCIIQDAFNNNGT